MYASDDHVSERGQPSVLHAHRRLIPHVTDIDDNLTPIGALTERWIVLYGRTRRSNADFSREFGEKFFIKVGMKMNLFE